MSAAKKILLKPHMPLCQSDYPLDWYQDDFVPYAEEYLALPDRNVSTVVKWMKGYVDPARDYFGDQLLLLAHYYMGGEIVKLVELFGGEIGDSYQLALKASNKPEKKVIVESAVHFMAESVSILAAEDQNVYITNPKAGCTMELLAKDYMVEPALAALNGRYGEANILPICYMNTSGRVKALTGKQGGAVCTSSNVKKIFEWALTKNKKIVFIPDQYMGENVASWLNISSDNIAYWPSGHQSVTFNLEAQDKKTLMQFDNAKVVLFSSGCSVHTYYTEKMVAYWRERGCTIIAHPECKNEVVSIADGFGSTAYIWEHVYTDTFGTQKYAVATENHMVQNLADACREKNIDVVNLGDAKLGGLPSMGCGCATMSRNDPPHLVATLDLLRQGKSLEKNIVLPGDVVNETSGQRDRLSENAQLDIVAHARKALERMIEITEAK